MSNLTMSMFLSKGDLEEARRIEKKLGPDFCYDNTRMETSEKPDPLLDRSCVYLDGACDCTPLDDCKYLRKTNG